jgi:hypothetical protein
MHSLLEYDDVSTALVQSFTSHLLSDRRNASASPGCLLKQFPSSIRWAAHVNASCDSHHLVEITEIVIIRLRRSGKFKGGDIGINSPGMHSFIVSWLLGLSTQLLLQMSQAGSRPTGDVALTVYRMVPKEQTALGFDAKMAPLMMAIGVYGLRLCVDTLLPGGVQKECQRLSCPLP